MKYKQQIVDLIKCCKSDGIATKVMHMSDIWKDIQEETKDITAKNVSERIYAYSIGLNTDLNCQCGKKRSFISIVEGYREFCNDRSCVYVRKASTERRIKVLKENGGIGLANPSTKKKAQQTNLKKYGVENSYNIPSVMDKTIHNNPMKNKDIIEKIRNNCINEYGVDWHSKRYDVKEKTLKTNIEKYGSNPSMVHYSSETIEYLNNYELMKSLFDTMTINEIATKLSISETSVLNQLKFLGIRQPYENIPERQIRDWLIYNGFTDFIKTRKILNNKNELDFYSPSLNFAIEYCGLYWHGHDKLKDEKKHRSKYLECKEKGIRLITIFEDELMFNRSLVFNRLGHLLHLPSEKIGARKLAVKNISISDSKEFLENHHMMGSSRTSVRYGAYDSFGKLRAVMTFVIKNNNKYEWELARFATDGTHIPGIASKLFSAFIKENDPKSVLSYSDLRWGEGDHLLHLGFNRHKDTVPGFWYFRTWNVDFARYHRLSHRSESLLKKYPELKKLGIEDGYHMAKFIGLEKIYDCGNAVWIWNKQSN